MSQEAGPGKQCSAALPLSRKRSEADENLCCSRRLFDGTKNFCDIHAGRLEVPVLMVNIQSQYGCIEFWMELHAPGTLPHTIGMIQLMFAGGKTNCPWRQGQDGLGMGDMCGE